MYTRIMLLAAWEERQADIATDREAPVAKSRK